MENELYNQKIESMASIIDNQVYTNKYLLNIIGENYIELGFNKEDYFEIEAIFDNMKEQYNKVKELVLKNKR